MQSANRFARIVEKGVRIMKKLIAIALVLVLALSALACAPAQQKVEGETPVSSTEKTEAKKTVYITLLCMNNMSTKEGAQQVQDELNRYLAEDAGKNYEVKIRDFLDLSSHMSGIDLALASGEELGVVLTDFRTGTMAANGQLLPLDSYLDNELAGAKELIGQDWLEAGTFNGEVFGVPVYKGVICRTYPGRNIEKMLLAFAEVHVPAYLLYSISLRLCVFGC